MKIFIFALCCIILTLPSTSVGGAIKDILGKAKTRTDTIREDVRTFFHLNQNSNKQQNDVIVFKDEDEARPLPTTEVVITKAVVTESTRTTQLPTSTVGSATKGNGTADGKDGRENFNGGCSTGFLRTPDGRCKPTF